MKIYIDTDITNLNDLLQEGFCIEITQLEKYTLDQLLAIPKLVIVASGQAVASQVALMLNSRPNENKLITMVQTHPDVTVLLDEEGAQQIL